MNPTNQFLKKQGLKVCLPLLLLATACGEGTTSSLQADANPIKVDPVAVSTSAGLNLGSSTTQSAPAAAVVSLPAEETPTLGEVLPPAPEEAPEEVTAPLTPVATGSTQVPEPTALAGLAIAAAGIVVVKRKQQAA